jgi:phage gpG-like protein
MITAHITGLNELKLTFSNIERGTPRMVNNILDRSASEVKRWAVYNVSNRYLRRRTGNLASSIAISWGIDRANPSRYIGTNVIYAHILHEGGVIRPVKAKSLAIPFPGVVGSPRDYNNTFVRNGVIFQGGQSAKGNRGWIKPLFSLRKQVTIKPHPFLSMALIQSLAKISVIINEESDKLIK